MYYLGKGEVLTNTDLDRFVRNIWEIWAFCVHRKCLRSLSSAHEKWGQKQKCCVYNFGQCNSSIDHHLGQRVGNLFWPKSQFFYFWLMHFSKTTYIYIYIYMHIHTYSVWGGLFDPLLILYVCPLTKKWSVYNFNSRFIWTVRDRITKHLTPSQNMT